MLRNVYDWDCDTETSFWAVINDRVWRIEELPSKTRNQVRRSLRDCDIRRLTNCELVDADGYNVYAKAFERYHDVTVNVAARDAWESVVLKSEKFEYWGVFRKEDGKLIAYGMNTVMDKSVNYNVLKAIPKYMNKHYPYFGLLYTMNDYYLSVCGKKYVTDGFRSLTEHSNIQPFLEKNFLFRKAYCKVKIYYKWWLKLAVKALYPFRNIIPNQQIKAVLRFEEIQS